MNSLEYFKGKLQTADKEQGNSGGLDNQLTV